MGVGTGMGMGHPLLAPWAARRGSSRRAAHTQLVTAHQPSWAELGSSNYRAPAEDLQLLSGRSIHRSRWTDFTCVVHVH